MSMLKNLICFDLCAAFLGIFLFVFQAFAANGDSAVFSFAPLNGKQGENEVKLLVNTDGAAINHLIFDILNVVDNLVFDISGNNDPVSFPLSGQSVLGTQTTFTTASGDFGYDLASANPTSTAAYAALHFVTLITDRNLAVGQGGVLNYDNDTAIFVNTVRKGNFASSYTVLPNQAPVIASPKVGSLSLAASISQPTFLSPFPLGFVQNLDVNPNFAFSVTDSTDASVARTMKIYKRLNDGTWNYDASPYFTINYSRNGSQLDFSHTLSSPKLEYATYYKVVFTATDDQGALDTETYYFATKADDQAPAKVARANMTFLGDSNDRSKVVSQISFTPSTDNNGISAYYLWSRQYLINKGILTSSGARNSVYDFDNNGTITDLEFSNALRNLNIGLNYIAKLSAQGLGSEPYFAVTGSQVDAADNTLVGNKYYVAESLAKDVLYIAAADSATDIAGNLVPNFSEFQLVSKVGDIFGAQVNLTLGASQLGYNVGDGRLDVWDSVFLYRQIVGSADFPILYPDFLHSNNYNYPVNLAAPSLSNVVGGYGGNALVGGSGG